MSCGTCGIQASAALQGDTGVPAGAPTTANQPRCPHCQAFISPTGAACTNPRCPGYTSPAAAPRPDNTAPIQDLLTQAGLDFTLETRRAREGTTVVLTPSSDCARAALPYLGVEIAAPTHPGVPPQAYVPPARLAQWQQELPARCAALPPAGSPPPPPPEALRRQRLFTRLQRTDWGQVRDYYHLTPAQTAPRAQPGAAAFRISGMFIDRAGRTGTAAEWLLRRVVLDDPAPLPDMPTLVRRLQHTDFASVCTAYGLRRLPARLGLPQYGAGYRTAHSWRSSDQAQSPASAASWMLRYALTAPWQDVFPASAPEGSPASPTADSPPLPRLTTPPVAVPGLDQVRAFALGPHQATEPIPAAHWEQDGLAIHVQVHGVRNAANAFTATHYTVRAETRRGSLTSAPCYHVNDLDAVIEQISTNASDLCGHGFTLTEPAGPGLRRTTCQECGCQFTYAAPV